MSLIHLHIFLSSLTDCLAHNRHSVFVEILERKDEQKSSKKTIICFVIYRKQLCRTFITMMRKNNS